MVGESFLSLSLSLSDTLSLSLSDTLFLFHSLCFSVPLALNISLSHSLFSLSLEPSPEHDPDGIVLFLLRRERMFQIKFVYYLPTCSIASLTYLGT